MITRDEAETVCQWAFDVDRAIHECVHGVQVGSEYMEKGRLSQLRGRHKTETVGVEAFWDGLQEGMAKSMFGQMIEQGGSVERRWRDSEGNLHIEKEDSLGIEPI